MRWFTVIVIAIAINGSMPQRPGPRRIRPRPGVRPRPVQIYVVPVPAVRPRPAPVVAPLRTLLGVAAVANAITRPQPYVPYLPPRPYVPYYPRPYVPYYPSPYYSYRRQQGII
ncbi:unnamed protein product [Cylicocyclus nassatus]|uniref:Uncharacterized protein n=1 Tax=Cylicocyclus nassatus TaxID=53992 RepID=A0AA36DPD0_CYLNA|nr:unnamed protein product [Cylicocyclus nassatus]